MEENTAEARFEANEIAVQAVYLDCIALSYAIRDLVLDLAEEMGRTRSVELDRLRKASAAHLQGLLIDIENEDKALAAKISEALPDDFSNPDADRS